MGRRVGGRAQHFKNAAQLHELKLDRIYRNRQLALMGQDFQRAWQETEAKAEGRSAPEQRIWQETEAKAESRSAPEQRIWQEAERKIEPETAPEPRSKPETALESDWRGHSWEKFMAELRRKYESVYDA